MGERHNGWTNYETWLVALWIDNDEGSQSYWREQAADCVNPDGECPDGGAGKLADRLKEEIADGDFAPKLDGFYADMMNAAFGSVNWEEIANSLIQLD